MYQSLGSYLVLALGISVVASVFCGIGAHVVGTVRAFATRTATVPPREYREKNAAGNRDPGWVTYTANQLGVDLTAQARAAWHAYGNQWRRVDRTVNHGAGIFFWFLFGVPLVAFASLALAFPLMVAVTVVFTTMFLAVLMVATNAYWILVAVVRTTDAIWVGAHGREASCPDCHHVMGRPAVRCPGCAQLHRDIRSGSEGVLFRLCECDRLLPTTVSRAAWSVPLACQRCEAPLHEGAGTIRDRRISLVGDVHAGKSRLALSSLGRLSAHARSDGRTFVYADPETESAVSGELAAINSGRSTATTDPSVTRSLTVRVGGAFRGTLIHLVDAAGARFHDASSHDKLTYFDQVHGVIFVVDPFAIQDVRRELARGGHVEVLVKHPADGEVEDVYGSVVNRLRSSGVRTRRKALAIVVTKADLLQDAGIQLPTGSDELRQWLEARGQHNMVLAAAQEFCSVRYFAAGSGGPVTEQDPARAVQWLLRPRVFESAERAAVSALAGGAR